MSVDHKVNFVVAYFCFGCCLGLVVLLFCCLNLGSYGCCLLLLLLFDLVLVVGFVVCLLSCLLSCCFAFVVWATTTKERTNPPITTEPVVL